MALPPDDIPKAIAGMEALAKNGLRYPSRNTASSRTSAPAWQSATPAEEADAHLTPAGFRRRPRRAERLGPRGRIGLALFASCVSSWVFLSGE